MKEFIKIIGKDLFLLNTELLGLKEAQLWIGPAPDGPLDNDDQRVFNERVAEMQKEGNPGQRISGIEAVDLIESEKYPSWFEVNTSSWINGTYRFNIHSKANVQAPNGTPLSTVRDGQYSWPALSDDQLMAFPDDQKVFWYLERNKAGFCIRIEITPEREIKPAGDGLEWISRWPQIRQQEVEPHYQGKIKQVGL